MGFGLEDNWQAFIEDGDRLLTTAENGWEQRPAVFTPEIIYNIVSMSMEKYIMGFLMHKGTLPDNHTLTDLASACRDIGLKNDELFGRLAEMDRFQEICCIDLYQRKIPSPEDVTLFLSTGKSMKEFIGHQLNQPQ